MKKISFISLLFITLLQNSYSQTIKKVLLEDFTANWVGWAPRGIALRDLLENVNQGNVIPVTFHYSDPLENTQSIGIGDSFSLAAFPSGMVDRKLFNGQTAVLMNTNDWSSSVSTRLAQSPALKVDIISNYEPLTRLSQVRVKATFNAPKTATMKVHLFYVEDSVVNFSSTYDQQNYYGQGCTAADTTNPFYAYPCVINGYPYMDVFRYSASGILGSGGVIPTSVNAGDTFSVNYSYTLPVAYNANRIKLVAFVSTTDKSVLNAESVPLVTCNCNLSAVAAITNVSAPNCNNGKIKVTLSGNITTNPVFELFDAPTGNQLLVFNAPSNTTSYTFTNLIPGTYNIKIKDGITCCYTELKDKIVKCPPPTAGLLTNTITSSSAKVKWNVVSCTNSYKVAYRIQGTTSWTNKTSGVNNKILNGLSPSTTYEWKVATNCFGSVPPVYSAYSAIQSFTTSPLRLGETQANTDAVPGIENLSVFPNPAFDEITVTCTSDFQSLNVEIININGQVVFKQEIQSEDENISLPIHVEELSSGLYSILISNEGAIKSLRFVKQ